MQRSVKPRTVIGTPDDREVRKIKNTKPAEAESFITYLSGVATVLAEAEAKAAELKAWFDHQRHAGRIVIETVDGEYMAIPAEAYATSEVIKREI